MTQEIIGLAKQAGIEDWWDQEIIDREGLQKHLEAFAELVAAKEREACAKHLDNQNTAITDILAAEIRARSKQ
jgi:hypothetical protein